MKASSTKKNHLTLTNPFNHHAWRGLQNLYAPVRSRPAPPNSQQKRKKEATPYSPLTSCRGNCRDSKFLVEFPQRSPSAQRFKNFVAPLFPRTFIGLNGASLLWSKTGCNAVLFSRSLLLMAGGASRNALRRLGRASLFRPTPDAVFNFQRWVDVVHFQRSRSATIDTGFTGKPFLPPIGNPFSLHALLYCPIFKWHRFSPARDLRCEALAGLARRCNQFTPFVRPIGSKLFASAALAAALLLPLTALSQTAPPRMPVRPDPKVLAGVDVCGLGCPPRARSQAIEWVLPGPFGGQGELGYDLFNQVGTLNARGFALHDLRELGLAPEVWPSDDSGVWLGSFQSDSAPVQRFRIGPDGHFIGEGISEHDALLFTLAMFEDYKARERGEAYKEYVARPAGGR